MDIVVLGIDLGKYSCSVVGLDATGRVTTSATDQTGVDRRINSAVVWMHRRDGALLW